MPGDNAETSSRQMTLKNIFFLLNKYPSWILGQCPGSIQVIFNRKRATLVSGEVICQKAAAKTSKVYILRVMD